MFPFSDILLPFSYSLSACILGFLTASLVKTPYKPPVKREPISLDWFILIKGQLADLSFLLLSIPYGMTTNYVAMYTQQIGITAETGFFFTLMAIGMAVSRKVSDRIVSINRHYVCPIVRGKETKSIEFGAKVNNIQTDGISFIGHISFKTFNEGIRLKDCISMQQKLMNMRVTSFARKGKATRDEPLRKILRSELSRERHPA